MTGNVEFGAVVLKVETIDRRKEDTDTHVERVSVKQKDGPWKAQLEGPQNAFIGLKPGSYISVKIDNPQKTITESMQTVKKK